MTFSAMLTTSQCEKWFSYWEQQRGVRSCINFDLFALLDFFFIYIKEKLHRMKISALDFDIKRTWCIHIPILIHEYG